MTIDITTCLGLLTHLCGFFNWMDGERYMYNMVSEKDQTRYQEKEKGKKKKDDKKIDKIKKKNKKFTITVLK
jgi:hypothetical protein